MTQEEVKALLSGKPEEIVTKLKVKSITIPSWEKLQKEYDPKQHPIMNTSEFPDIVKEDGTIEKLRRLTENLQKLAVEKTSSLCVGIPVKRAYTPENDGQKEVAKVLEKILKKNNIDDVNIDRCNKLFASCEVFTLWYSVAETNNLYGLKVPSKIKVKCQTYSPLSGDSLYPLMDRYGDMIAMSFGSKEKQGEKEIEYFDVYTSDTHICFENNGDGWIDVLNEKITIGKIPGVYAHRSEPIWENTSSIVYDGEELLSRNSGYLRKNLQPLFGIFADEEVSTGEKDDDASLGVLQFPKGSNAKYITWDQAIEGLKFQKLQLRQSFFAQLQLSDTAFDSMKTTPMSGEARQMMFIDGILKVLQLRGMLKKLYNREINVLKAFVKILMPGYDDDIDALGVENIITPFTLRSAKEDIENLTTANGGKQIMSQRESIERAGFSDDVDKTLEEIANENMADIGEATI